MQKVWMRWVPVWIFLLFGTGLASAAGEDYQLGPGDLLKVTVYGYEELTTEVRISQTGYINYPLLGEVSNTGISPRDAAARIASKLMAGGFIREPKVDVLVVEYQSQKISVMGQVTKPGKYALTASSTVLDMLAGAGGVVGELVVGGPKKTLELDLGYGAHAGHRQADGRAHDARLGQRRVHHAIAAEALEEPLGDAEHAAVEADILAEDDDAVVLLHFLGEGEVDGLDESEVGHGVVQRSK